MKGTSNMAEHQITMKDDIPIKQRYYPKNPKVQGEINARVDELLQMGYVEHSTSPYSFPIVMVKKDGQMETVRRPTEGSTVHQQLGPNGWVLANPTESKQQAVHGVYSAGERPTPVESNAIRTSFGVCDLSTGAGPLISLPG